MNFRALLDYLWRHGRPPPLPVERVSDIPADGPVAEMFRQAALRREQRARMAPSPTGARCCGCNRPARPLVKCACGVMVCETSPPGQPTIRPPTHPTKGRR